jgi:hypothetical protein
MSKKVILQREKNPHNLTTTKINNDLQGQFRAKTHFGSVKCTKTPSIIAICVQMKPQISDLMPSKAAFFNNFSLSTLFSSLRNYFHFHFRSEVCLALLALGASWMCERESVHVKCFQRVRNPTIGRKNILIHDIFFHLLVVYN